jgi:putative transposase
MTYPLVLDFAADGIPVAVTCRVLGFSKQAFYHWRKYPISQRDWDDAHLINAAVDIHHDDPGFGYPFIADELPSHGIKAGEGRPAVLPAAHLVRPRPQAGPEPQGRATRARRSRRPPVQRRWPGPAVADRHHRPRHRRGKLYLCAIKDVWSNRIVGILKCCLSNGGDNGSQQQSQYAEEHRQGLPGQLITRPCDETRRGMNHPFLDLIPADGRTCHRLRNRVSQRGLPRPHGAAEDHKRGSEVTCKASLRSGPLG